MQLQHLLDPRTRGGAAGAFLLVFVLLVAWWSRIRPAQGRAWAPEYSVLPRATVEGDRVTLHDVRNFEYRTATDFTPRYEDRTYDLGKLDSVDLVASYWMGEAIAHVMLFCFCATLSLSVHGWIWGLAVTKPSRKRNVASSISV